MKYLLALFLLFLSTCSFADEAFVGYGLGVSESAVNSKAETKMVYIGEREFLLNGIYWQNKLGFWGDGSGNPNRSSSFYGSSGLGLELDLQPLELHSGYGLAAISSPDEYLGGRFPQFQGEAGAMLRDKKGDGIGLTYTHISSAGLVTPNQGRDFVTLELSIKWY
jgi:hypothetical protein